MAPTYAMKFIKEGMIREMRRQGISLLEAELQFTNAVSMATDEIRNDVDAGLLK